MDSSHPLRWRWKGACNQRFDLVSYFLYGGFALVGPVEVHGE
jgi:hypothetical protein